MRTPTDPNDRPLVLPPRPAPAPAPAGEKWRSTETPGIERNERGQVRTNTPPPPIFTPAPAAAPARAPAPYSPDLIPGPWASGV